MIRGSRPFYLGSRSPTVAKGEVPLPEETGDETNQKPKVSSVLICVEETSVFSGGKDGRPEL